MNTTYELGKAFTNARIACLKFETILNELPPDRKARSFIKEAVRLLKRLELDFKVAIGNEAFNLILKQQLLNPEYSGQIDLINDYLLELPKGMRDQIESYIEGLHKIYKTTQNEKI